MSKAALEICQLHAWHNQQAIILDLNLFANRGEAIALVSNSYYTQLALLNCLFGLNPKRRGSIRIHQAESIHLGPRHILHLGMAFSSKQNGLIADLSCEENLLMPFKDASLGGGLSLAEIYLLFPILYDFRYMPYTQLSPGEQQLLALARILRTGADIIVFHNLYSDICPAMHTTLTQLLTELKERGYTLVFNESNPIFAASLADRMYLIQNTKAKQLHV